ncbi:(R)-1-hydroxy-2-aminoethylphosphonate ammonia-lyase [Marinifilum sp.]|uniref:(R)-1-hydroxy-2-aminoethylphosphonate ammonia-lyase n=1 Tax=Marinifilum sp. TaxID=2033137 RepID=UPI003BAC522F
MTKIKHASAEQSEPNNSKERLNYKQSLTDKETLKWLEADEKYFLHQELSTPVMNMLSKAIGASIYDLTGKKYLDMHGNGVHNVGFNRKEVIAAAHEQLNSDLNFTPRRYSNIPTIQLAKKLIEVSPKGLERVLFCPGGSQAIEMAVMLAKQVTGRFKTISYWGSYHGTGFQAASIGAEEHFSTGNGPMLPGTFYVDFPNLYRNPWGFTTAEQVEKECIRQIKNVINHHPDIACIVGEPISATPWVPSKKYWQEIRNICDEHGILLIFDEVIEGFGRTGKMFASDHFITPDVLVMGKSLGGGLVPFAGILTKEKFNVLQHRSIGHYTHEKNPLCSAIALANIEVIEKEGLLEKAAENGKYLKHRLLELKNKYPLVGNVEGVGMHLGIDLVKDEVSKEKAREEAEKIMYLAMEQGVAFKIIEGNVLTLRPSLVITKEEIDEVAKVLDEAIGKIVNG